MNKSINIVLQLFMICTSYLSSAQSHNYTQYTMEDGLVSNYLYNLLEDDEGNLWIPSTDGISKFDGYTFKNFTVEDGLPINENYLIKKDTTGCLWLANNSGKICYIKNDSIICLDGYDDYKITLSFSNEIRYYKKDTFLEMSGGIVIRNHPTYNLDSLANIVEQKLDAPISNFSAYGPVGKYTMAIKNNTIFQIEKDTIINYLFEGEYFTTALSSNKFYAFKTNKGIEVVYMPKKLHRFFPHKKFGDSFKDVSLRGAESSPLTIQSPKGLFCINEQLKLTKARYSANIYNNYNVQHHLEDSQGNQWIATQEGGLFLIKKQSLRAKYFQNDIQKNNKFELLANSPNGIYAFTSNGEIFKIKTKGLNPAVSVNGISHSYAIRPFNSGFLFSSNNYLRVFYPANDKVEDFISKEAFKTYQLNTLNYNQYSLLNNIKTFDIAKDIVLYSNHQFVNLLNLEQKIISIISTDRAQLIHKSIFNEGFYIASRHKLLLYNHLNNTFDTLVNCNDGFIKDELINACKEQYNSILELSPVKLLMASENKGVFLTDLEEKSLQQISKRNQVKKIIQHQQHYYFAGKDGVSILDTAFNELYNYTKADGLPLTKVNDIVVNDTAIFAATNNGVAIIDKRIDVFKKEDKTASLSIQSIQSDNAVFNNFNQLSFKNNDNNIKINYHFLDFESVYNIQYAYKLSPVEKDWNYTAERTANYADLRYGDYTFHLKAIDAFGDEHQIKNCLTFHIQKAFWQTYPFIFISIFSMVGLVYYLIKSSLNKQYKRLTKEKELNNKIAELKIESLRAQMNPHFIFNALGSIQYYIRDHKIEEADEYLALFAQLMRRYLDSAAENVIKLKDELQLLSEYTELEEMRFEIKFKTQIEVDAGIAPRDEWLPSMLIQPYVENAISHGLQKREKGGLLHIKFCKQHENELICEISDNGIGVANSKKHKRKGHKSRAMQNVQDRLQVFENSGIAQVKVSTHNVCDDPFFPGTKVKLRFLNFNKYEELHRHNNRR